jgi:hypothetical protein
MYRQEVVMKNKKSSMSEKEWLDRFASKKEPTKAAY